MLFDALVHPTSFTQTVENFFDLTFLVKDSKRFGPVIIHIDADNLPYICRGPPNSLAGEEQQVMSHFIQRLDMKTWKVSSIFRNIRWLVSKKIMMAHSSSILSFTIFESFRPFCLSLFFLTTCSTGLMFTKSPNHLFRLVSLKLKLKRMGIMMKNLINWIVDTP